MNFKTISRLVKASGVTEVMLVHFRGEDEDKWLANKLYGSGCRSGCVRGAFAAGACRNPIDQARFTVPARHILVG